jgi:RNA polymerase-binding protein DksA
MPTKATKAASPSTKAATGRGEAAATKAEGKAAGTASRARTAPKKEPVGRAPTAEEAPERTTKTPGRKQPARTAQASGSSKAAAPAKKAPAKAPAPAGKAPARKAPATKEPARKAAAKRAERPSGQAAWLAAQRRLLEEERARLAEQARALKAEADQLAEEMEPGDIQFDEESGEGNTVSVERERDLALSAQALAEIEEIDRALAKIDAGTYGICESCGKPIPKERLKYVPQATLCVPCKSRGPLRT